MSSRRLAAAACALSVVAVVGCGSDSGGGDSDATVPANATVVKAVEGILWESDSYTAASTDGTIVVAGENDSSLPHNLYIIAADGTQLPSHIDLPRKGSDGVETVTAAPGTYTIICKIPGHDKMKATLTVS